MSRALALGLLLLSGLALAGPSGRRYALVVGVNQGDAGEQELRYAQSDAERIARILRDHGGFQPEDVLVLTEVGTDSMRRALIGLNARLRAAPAPELLFVFYSGHGDANTLHLQGTRFELEELRGLVAGSTARARVLVVDACRSGTLTRVKGGSPGSSFVIDMDVPPAAEGFAVLTSSAAGEDAQESDALGASFFTHYLVSALLGAADENEDGGVSLAEAFAYASERTLAATASTVAGPQHPTYRFELSGREELLLSRPGAQARGFGQLEFPEPGSYLVHRGGPGGAVAAEVASQVPGRRLTLPAGRYHVIHRAADHLREGGLELPAGGRARVDGGALRRVDYARVVRKGSTQRSRAWSAIVGASVRGAVLELGAGWRAEGGLRLDLPVLSVELRAGLGRATAESPRLRIRTHEVALELAAVRALELGPFTLGGGVLAGGLWLRQDFGEPQTPSRASLGLLFGPLVQAQVALHGPLYLRVEAAALTVLLRAGNAPQALRLETPVSPRGMLGLGVYF